MTTEVLERSKVLDILREIKPLLQAKYGVTRLGIFGSVARDGAGEQSDSDHGIDMLDGIGMMLIAIGENLKAIDRDTQGSLLQRYNSISWKQAKGVRDILSHYYFDVDTTEGGIEQTIYFCLFLFDSS